MTNILIGPDSSNDIYFVNFIKEHFGCKHELFIYDDSFILGHMTSEQINFIVYFEHENLIVAMLSDEHVEIDIIQEQKELIKVIEEYQDKFRDFDVDENPEIANFINFLRQIDYTDLLEKNS